MKKPETAARTETEIFAIGMGHSKQFRVCAEGHYDQVTVITARVDWQGGMHVDSMEEREWSVDGWEYIPDRDCPPGQSHATPFTGEYFYVWGPGLARPLIAHWKDGAWKTPEGVLVGCRFYLPAVKSPTITQKHRRPEYVG